MDLPHELRLGLERELRAERSAVLTRAAAELSTSYRDSGRAPGPLGDDAALAYAATRMPATYAAISAALAALTAAMPTFQPRSLLDAGAGTAATLWAAAQCWESLATATLLERERAMATLGARLAAGSRLPAMAGATWRSTDLLAPWEAPAHDLVTASYVLGELPENTRPHLVTRLWERAAEVLVLIEPGTPRGWATIRAAREQLRSAGAQIVAPCPHQGPCPLAADDWCHFAQRLTRTSAIRAAKGAERGFEDEKFSYLAVARQTAAPITARVLRRPVVRPGRIELALCAASGLRHELVTRASTHKWRLARDLRWGDAISSGTWEEL